MKKISIVSGSRAEIDLIIQLLLKFEKSKKFQLQIILTGAHLAKDYGNTFTNIKKYNFSNVTKVDIEINKSSTKQILKSISLGVSKFSSILHRYNPDLIIIPGDRYEMIAVGICAHFMNIRIAHIFGGDVTNGSLDDSIRHCLTKLSDYHFVTSKESKKRVMQLGEINKNIFLVGNPGLDSIKKINFLDKKYFEKKYLIKFKKQIAFVTIHPDASNRSSTIKLTENLLKALIELKDFTLIFSKPNADIYSDEVMSRIKKFVYENNNAYYFDNLGHQKFLSLLKLSNFMIGNSSAGLSEMPYFRKPTINIGERQDGRIKPKSVLDCKPIHKDIKKTIKSALNKKFIMKLKSQKYHLGYFGASNKIYQIISSINFKKNKQYKRFIDL